MLTAQVADWIPTPSSIRNPSTAWEHWAPVGVGLPQTPLDQETIALIIRITGGNFRLLNRLLTQIQRILEINTLKEVTKAVVGAARESLVIGQVWCVEGTYFAPGQGLTQSSNEKYLVITKQSS
jgi:hypothetical protein